MAKQARDAAQKLKHSAMLAEARFGVELVA
jgi:hypothetical protein